MLSSEKSQNIFRLLNIILPPTRMATDDETLLKYGTSLEGTVVKPLAVLFPISTQEIQAILKISNEFRLPVHAISRGKNFGYGESQSTTPEQIVLDLSQMNQIKEVNSELCYARIEPGVSQQELYSHLQSLPGRKLRLDVTAVGLHGSVVGNVVERGFGHTDYGNRFDRVLSMTVVLANGNVIRTGMSGWPGSHARSVYRYGIGPMLDGIFSQSNFGIITEMTFELAPVPEKTLCFFLMAKTEEELQPLIKAIRELKLEGTIQSAVHVANRARVAGKESSIAGEWSMSGVISGSAIVVRAKKKRIKQLIRKELPRSRMFFLSTVGLRFLHWINNTIIKVPSLNLIDDSVALLMGKPTDGPLKTLLDSKKVHSTVAASDFPKYLRWISAITPADPAIVQQAVDLLEGLFKKYNYEFRITMTAISPRALVIISNIVDERTEEGQLRSMKFYQVCVEALLLAGFYPYRSGPGLFSSLPPYPRDTQNLLNSLKQVFDPQGVLSPGKYNIPLSFPQFPNE